MESLYLLVALFILIWAIPRESQHCGQHKVLTRISQSIPWAAFIDIHFSAPVDFLFQESFLLKRNVLARISLCSLIWVDTFLRVHNVNFLMEWLILFQLLLNEAFKKYFWTWYTIKKILKNNKLKMWKTLASQIYGCIVDIFLV